MKLKLCFNCLGTHRASSCRVTSRCLKCGHKHHTTIHDEKITKSNLESRKSTESSVANAKTSESHVLHSSADRRAVPSSVLLATAQVTVISPTGEAVTARALLDQGSEISLIFERLVQSLRLLRKKSILSLVGIGAQNSHKTKGIASFKVRPYFSEEFEWSISAHILPKLTGSIPSRKIDNGEFKGTATSRQRLHFIKKH